MPRAVVRSPNTRSAAASPVGTRTSPVSSARYTASPSGSVRETATVPFVPAEAACACDQYLPVPGSTSTHSSPAAVSTGEVASATTRSVRCTAVLAMSTRTTVPAAAE